MTFQFLRGIGDPEEHDLVELSGFSARVAIWHIRIRHLVSLSKSGACQYVVLGCTISMLEGTGSVDSVGKNARPTAPSALLPVGILP